MADLYQRQLAVVMSFLTVHSVQKYLLTFAFWERAGLGADWSEHLLVVGDGTTGAVEWEQDQGLTGRDHGQAQPDDPTVWEYFHIHQTNRSLNASFSTSSYLKVKTNSGKYERLK